jgi:hypothetical protein
MSQNYNLNENSSCTINALKVTCFNKACTFANICIIRKCIHQIYFLRHDNALSHNVGFDAGDILSLPDHYKVSATQDIPTLLNIISLLVSNILLPNLAINVHAVEKETNWGWIM